MISMSKGRIHASSGQPGEVTFVDRGEEIPQGFGIANDHHRDSALKLGGALATGLVEGHEDHRVGGEGPRPAGVEAGHHSIPRSDGLRLRVDADVVGSELQSHGTHEPEHTMFGGRVVGHHRRAFDAPRAGEDHHAGAVVDEVRGHSLAERHTPRRLTSNMLVQASSSSS